MTAALTSCKIGLMIYIFARGGAALAMKREDVFVQGRRLWLFHTPQNPGWFVQGEFA